MNNMEKMSRNLATEVIKKSIQRHKNIFGWVNIKNKRFLKEATRGEYKENLSYSFVEGVTTKNKDDFEIYKKGDRILLKEKKENVSKWGNYLSSLYLFFISFIDFLKKRWHLFFSSSSNKNHSSSQQKRTKKGVPKRQHTPSFERGTKKKTTPHKNTSLSKENNHSKPDSNPGLLKQLRWGKIEDFGQFCDIVRIRKVVTKFQDLTIYLLEDKGLSKKAQKEALYSLSLIYLMKIWKERYLKRQIFMGTDEALFAIGLYTKEKLPIYAYFVRNKREEKPHNGDTVPYYSFEDFILPTDPLFEEVKRKNAYFSIEKLDKSPLYPIDNKDVGQLFYDPSERILLPTLEEYLGILQKITLFKLPSHMWEDLPIWEEEKINVSTPKDILKITKSEKQRLTEKVVTEKKYYLPLIENLEKSIEKTLQILKRNPLFAQPGIDIEKGEKILLAPVSFLLEDKFHQCYIQIENSQEGKKITHIQTGINFLFSTFFLTGYIKDSEK